MLWRCWLFLYFNDIFEFYYYRSLHGKQCLFFHAIWQEGFGQTAAVQILLANLLRAMGNSFVPLLFLGLSAVLNIFLDLFCVIQLNMGVEGAALATIISQYVSALGLLAYYCRKCPKLWVYKSHRKWSNRILKEITGLSVLTCVQQSKLMHLPMHRYRISAMLSQHLWHKTTARAIRNASKKG